MEHDFGVQKSQKNDLELQISRLQETKSEVERRNESLRREIDLLRHDKTFLGSENNKLEDKVKQLEDKVGRTELSLLDAKKRAENYMERVLAVNDDVKSKFELQYTNEI